ncbi:MAG TPA: hypothetical protein VJ852_10135 [Gemmatimonadaceae bacterium]|nr:hypothetical protein [Gemmatimonadaceae bacterium]
MKSSQTVLLSVLVFAAASSASAQVSSSTAANASAAPAPAPTVAGPAESWTANGVGKSRITLVMPSHNMTADVTVREEAGKLIANIWPVGDIDGRDFDATLKGTQLVISGTTEHGVLGLTLEHRGSQITGTWQLGEQNGAVSGEIVK